MSERDSGKWIIYSVHTYDEPDPSVGVAGCGRGNGGKVDEEDEWCAVTHTSQAAGMVEVYLTRLTYVGLWASLAMLMTIIPFTKGETGAVALTTLFSVMLIAAVMTIRGNRRLKLIALFFLILSISARWLSLLTGEIVLKLHHISFRARPSPG